METTNTETQSTDTLLSVKDLSVHYNIREEGRCKAVNGVSFDIKRGQTLGLVGETGAGKTSIALSIMGLLPVPPSEIMGGEIIFEGEDLLKKSTSSMRKIRGKKISMIFQDPMSALNPVDRVDAQIAEVIRLHDKRLSRADSLKKALDALEMVGIPAERGSEYPHQFSGGMKQRIVIAMAMCCEPSLLIADEPTTALDVTIQAQVLEMMNQLKKEQHTSMIMITHDLGIVAKMCDRVAIIYGGEIIEIGDAWQVYDETAHPYTHGLFNSLPNINSDVHRLNPIMGMMPDPMHLPEGCKFAPRCKYRTEACEAQSIPLTELSDGHCVRCLYPQMKEKR